MKKLDDTDLSALLKTAESDFKGEVEASIVKSIRHVLYEGHNASLKVERLTADLEKAKALLAKSLERLDKMRSGDWSSIPETPVDNKEK